MRSFATEESITLKNGTRKYGMVLGRESSAEIPYWKFVSNNHLREFRNSGQSTLVERIPEYLIAYIDRYLK